MTVAVGVDARVDRGLSVAADRVERFSELREFHDEHEKRGHRDRDDENEGTDAENWPRPNR